MKSVSPRSIDSLFGALCTLQDQADAALPRRLPLSSVWASAVILMTLDPRFIAMIVLLIASLGAAGCRQAASQSEKTSAGLAPYRDIAAESGLIFRHDNGMSGKMYMPEMAGSGAALFDYNNDGKIDVFVVQSGPLAPGAASDREKRPTHRLFRNDASSGPDGRMVLHFTDVTKEASLQFSDYGMGVIAGDYDGDGFQDLYITCLGKNRLLHNDGHGSFSDVTDAAGVGGSADAWHTSAAWVDIDRDGRLDLFVCSYLEWSFALHKVCSSQGHEEYCGPTSFAPARSQLFRNLGGGKFEEISLKSRVASLAGAALGVVCSDFDGDGWPDLLVANDGMANYLWINRRDGTFAEDGLMRGCALNWSGASEANMGVVSADFHNSGWDDLFITHLTREHATFFRNLGRGQFEDRTASLGLDAPTRPFTGFGASALDYDNDGRLDIFIANGAVKVVEAQLKAGLQPPLRQRAQLFHNDGASEPHFSEIRDGAFLQVEDVGRGVAVGDLDNDGRPDLVVANNNGPLRLLINQTPKTNHWLGLRLAAGPKEARRDVLGAIAKLLRPGQPTLQRRSATDGSYLSSSDPRVLFGLGNTAIPARVTVQWPDGSEEEWAGLEPDQYHELVLGSGKPVIRSTR